MAVTGSIPETLHIQIIKRMKVRVLIDYTKT